MPIDLGLSRVLTLLTRLGNPQLSQNFIHVAGTNGKGSVCAYLTSILKSTTTLKIGKFTSPHLIYPHDCITLDNNPVKLELFRKVQDDVVGLNTKYDIGCTEFEILTIVAFKIFELEKVDLTVLEVGLGGRLDATNIIEPAEFNQNTNQISKKGVIVTGITKIGKDHENLLGDTLSQIAFEKAGIIKKGIPNVCDGSNDPAVLDVITEKAQRENTMNILVSSDSTEINTAKWGLVDRNESPLKGDYQLQNLSVALKIMELAFHVLEPTYPGRVDSSLTNVKKGIRSTSWPGRLQSLNLKYNKDSTIPILLDGAHNAQSAKELNKYLKSTYDDDSLSFIIALTRGKDIDEVLKELDIKPKDKVVLTEFGVVDGMPWIQANDPEDIKEKMLKYTENITIEREISKVFDIVRDDKNVIVCGSLYLVGEVLKLHNENTN